MLYSPAQLIGGGLQEGLTVLNAPFNLIFHATKLFIPALTCLFTENVGLFLKTLLAF